MAVHTVSKGLDIPLAGAPTQTISPARAVQQVAVLARDYIGLKARVLVEPGDSVQVGQPVLEHRTYGAIKFVAPAAGEVIAVHRGERRALQSVVIAVDAARDEAQDTYDHSDLRAARFTPAGARALLQATGLWTALRTRPFSVIPAPDAIPHALFVTAMDSNPLAPDLDVVMRGREQDIAHGLSVLMLLLDGPVYLCRHAGSTIGDHAADSRAAFSRVRIEEFSGKHPAGTAGYHIHRLDPVHRDKSVWHIGIQDVARIGRVFDSAQFDHSVIVALGGPGVRSPRLLRTRLGASLTELLQQELTADDVGATEEVRVISGSVLSGHRAQEAEHAFLGRFHQQVTVVPERRTREFLGWMTPGARTFSAVPAFLSALLPKRTYALDTRLHGSRRAMVPIGAYERVMPMDLMPTHLLRALAVGDVEWAESLGALELDEEDLALCTFVCPGKYEHGEALRRTLTTIAAES